MTNQIMWHSAKGTLRTEEINKVENALGIQFPKDYIKVVSKNDGGYPNLYSFNINNREEGINNLISFKGPSYSNILGTIDAASDRLISGLIPIGEDAGGNLMCFDFRDGNNPNVVFWDHEIAGGGNLDGAISYISDNFTDFLAMLHESSEE